MMLKLFITNHVHIQEVRWPKKAMYGINTQLNRKYSWYALLLHHNFLTVVVAVINSKSRHPSPRGCLAILGGPTPQRLIEKVTAVVVLCIRPSDHRFNLRVVYSEWFWLPVWLEKVNIECPCPVLKHSFLCDETVMAALPSPLVWHVHCAFVRSQRFIIMIRYWKMIRIPVEERK